MNDSEGLPGEGSSGRRAERPKSPAGFSAARGAGLVALAVIVGIVLLNTIDDGNTGPVGDGGASSTTTTTTTVAGGGPTSTTSTTKPAPVPPAQVTVRVLNGAGVDGVASTLTNTLKAKGYRTLAPTNASVRKGTVVNAKAGRTDECTTLATSVPGAKVASMPTPVPGGIDADCIVIIGT